MSSKGIVSTTLAIIIVAVLVIGGGAAWLLLRDGDDGVSESASNSSDEPAASETVDSSTFSGSYFDAIGRNTPLQCKWRIPEELAGEFQVGEGDFYTDGVGRGRSDAAFENEGVQAVAHSIFNEEAVYSWTEIAGAPAIGIKISRSALESSGDDLTEEERQQGEEFRANYSFDCEPWTLDESKFSLPEGVDFREV